MGMKISTVYTQLNDQKVGARVEASESGIDIFVDGYGNKCVQSGYASVILVEYHEGELRVIIWGDYNSENPTHIISLEKAREKGVS